MLLESTSFISAETAAETAVLQATSRPCRASERNGDWNAPDKPPKIPWVRVAVISDIHADLPALQRVLSAIGSTRFDEVWCLGDIVGLGGDDPAAVVNVVREHCVLALGGNHDAWVTGALTLDLLPLPRQQMALRWQCAELSGEQLGWLAALPSRAERAGVELWHGSAEDPLTGWVSTQADATAHLHRQQAGIGLVGHTHRAAVAHGRSSAVRWQEPPPERLDLHSGGRWLLNPGAVTGSRSWLDLDLVTAVATWHRA